MSQALITTAGCFNACFGALGLVVFALAISVGVDIETEGTYSIKLLFLYPSLVWLATALYCFNHQHVRSSRFGPVLFYLNTLPIAIIIGLLVYEWVIWAELSSFVIYHMLDITLLLSPVLALHAVNMRISQHVE